MSDKSKSGVTTVLVVAVIYFGGRIYANHRATAFANASWSKLEDDGLKELTIISSLHRELANPGLAEAFREESQAWRREAVINRGFFSSPYVPKSATYFELVLRRVAKSHPQHTHAINDYFGSRDPRGTEDLEELERQLEEMNSAPSARPSTRAATRDAGPATRTSQGR